MKVIKLHSEIIKTMTVVSLILVVVVVEMTIVGAASIAAEIILIIPTIEVKVIMIKYNHVPTQ